MSDENKGFTVKDRRLFTPDGERRGSGPAQETERPHVPPEPPRVPSSTPDLAGEGQRRLGDEVSLASFLMSLAAQAGALLDSGAAEALNGAREIISILEMLKDKTEGRRTPEEDRALEGLLYELRMAYVERSRMARA